MRASASARTARVELPTGRLIALEGVAADLVLLVAMRHLSPRTLRLLLCLAANEQHLSSLTTGRVEIDLSARFVHPYIRRTLPRIDLEEDQRAPA